MCISALLCFSTAEILFCYLSSLNKYLTVNLNNMQIINTVSVIFNYSTKPMWHKFIIAEKCEYEREDLTSYSNLMVMLHLHIKLWQERCAYSYMGDLCPYLKWITSNKMDWGVFMYFYLSVLVQVSWIQESWSFTVRMSAPQLPVTHFMIKTYIFVNSRVFILIWHWNGSHFSFTADCSVLSITCSFQAKSLSVWTALWEFVI